jgi:RNA 2',3'-cyclic 3'-phosphodiesterase
VESPRLFVALEIPAHVRDDLRASLEPWRAELVGFRWVPPENWHATLLFLGATTADRIAWVRARLKETVAGVVAFDTALTTFGGFPSEARARVVWAGLDDGAGRIGGLARSVRESLEVGPEERPFAAHVTVARSDHPRALPQALIASALPAESFTVGELVLFRSHLARPTPRYQPLARFPFAPRPDS